MTYLLKFWLLYWSRRQTMSDRETRGAERASSVFTFSIRTDESCPGAQPRGPYVSLGMTDLWRETPAALLWVIVMLGTWFHQRRNKLCNVILPFLFGRNECVKRNNYRTQHPSYLQCIIFSARLFLTLPMPAASTCDGDGTRVHCQWRCEGYSLILSVHTLINGLSAIQCNGFSL